MEGRYFGDTCRTRRESQSDVMSYEKVGPRGTYLRRTRSVEMSTRKHQMLMLMMMCISVAGPKSTNFFAEVSRINDSIATPTLYHRE